MGTITGMLLHYYIVPIMQALQASPLKMSSVVTALHGAFLVEQYVYEWTGHFSGDVTS